MSNQPDINRLCHMILFHDARISIINLPTVLGHFNFQKRLKEQRTPQLFKSKERPVRFPPLSRYLEKAEGASVVIGFLSALGSRCVSRLIGTAPRQTTRHSRRSLSQASFNRSRGHPFFRGHRHPEHSYTLSTIQSLQARHSQ